MPLGSGEPRFLSLSDVSDVLNISAAQAYALVRRGDLAAIKIGGRGQWRVEASELEARPAARAVTFDPNGTFEAWSEAW